MVDKQNSKEHQKDIALIKQTTLQRIENARSKPKLHQEEVYHIVKYFFKKILEIDYEFTHQELLEELEKMYLEKKHHEQISEFITTIGIMEYTDKEFTQSELKTLLKELSEIVNSLIKHHTKEHWLKKISSALHLRKDTKTQEIKKTTINSDDDLYNVLLMIENEPVKKHATTLYKKAIEYYNGLSNEDKKKHFDRLKQAEKHLSSK